jgi:competence protein ComEC
VTTLSRFMLALGIAIPALVQADGIAAQELFVTPSDRVTRFVNVRELSSSDSDTIARLSPGERLPLVDSIPGWREVRLADGRSGFVSKSWAVVVPGPPPGSDEELRIHFLSIGAGTCTVVECPGLGALPIIVDCGSSGGRGDMALERDEARQRIQEILAEHGTAANVVLSHGDVDHYRWIPHVLGEMSIQHIWQGGDPDTYGSDGFPTWIGRQEADGAVIHRDFPVHWHNDGEPLGDDLSCGLASTFVLTVNSGAGTSTNTDSLVLMIEYEDFTVIFSGDAVGITEEFAEANFRGAVKASMVSASHHGAVTFESNSSAWAEATAPAVIVYSSGQLHGHPRCPATETYRSFLAAAPNHETHCNRTSDYAQREIADSVLAEYITDVVGSIVVSSNGRSPMKLVCEAGTGCGGEFPH